MAESAGKLVSGVKAKHSQAQVVLAHMDALPDWYLTKPPPKAAPRAMPVGRRIRRRSRCSWPMPQITPSAFKPRFAAQLEALSAGFGFSATLPPLVAFQEMEQLIAEEQQVVARGADLRQRLAAVFAAGIKTASLDDLRSAVSSGTNAIALRKTVNDTTQTLLASLNVRDIEAALALLEATAPSDIPDT